MTISVNKTYILDFSILLLVFLTSSFVVLNDIISSSLTIGLWLIFLLLQFFQSKPTIHKKQLIGFCVLTIIMWISVIYNNEDVRNATMLTFAFFSVFMFTQNHTFDSFVKEYIKVMVLVATFSLVLYLVYLLIPSLNSVNLIANGSGNYYSNLFIYINSVTQKRNMGMFWEPGAFQTFLSLALFFDIAGNTINIKRFLMLTICLITTFSTTGYIALIFLIGFILIKRNVNNRKVKIPVIITLFVLLILAFINKDSLFNTDNFSVFGKVISFFESGWYTTTGHLSSASVRYYSIVKPLSLFFQSPIVGYGYEGLQKLTFNYTYGMNTCTFINWFAIYGIVFGVAMTTGYLGLCRRFSKDIIQILLSVTILFLVTMSENYVNNAFFIMLALYGFNYLWSESEYIESSSN